MASFNYIQETGVVVADTLTTLAETQQVFRDAAGDQNLTVDSGPASVLINAITEAKDGVARSNAQGVNQINPRIAGGVMLNAIMALTGSEIGAPQRTRVECTLTGTAGTEVNAGAFAVTNPTLTGGIQYKFYCEAPVIIGAGGTVSAFFLADEYGPISIPPNSLTSISTSIIGWLGITNPLEGVAGRLQQSDSSARFSRVEQLGVQSSTLPARTVGAVSAIPDVRSLSYYNNTASTDTTVGGKLILANTQYACIDGGSDADIIEALGKSQSGGCAWTGDEFGDYDDGISADVYPVRWDRTAAIAVDIEVTIRPSGSFQNPEGVTKDAVIAYANGLVDGYRGFVTNADVNPFEIVEAANIFSPAINAIKCRVALDGGVLGFDNVPMNIFEKASIIETNITVIIL